MTAAGGRTQVHFYVPDKKVARALTTWNPDTEPTRYSDGMGHNLYELYARLRASGLPVTAGPHIPRRSRLVVGYFNSGGRLQELGFAWRSAPFRVLLIRSDAHLWWEPLVEPDVVIVPNGIGYWEERYGSRARYVPALPQRGLVPRDPARTAVRSLTFKGNPENAPAYLYSPRFRAALEERGIVLEADIPAISGGSDQRWHDFHDVDVALCVRRSSLRPEELLHKPPTRLVNAWNAGVLPFATPEPGYAELLEDGVDGFLVRDEDDILTTLDHLLTDPAAQERAWAAVRRRAAEYAPTALLEEWASVLAEASGPREPLRSRVARRAAALRRFVRTATPAIRERLRERLGGRLVGGRAGRRRRAQPRSR